MRVTNEQARAITICLESGIDCPVNCPNYGKDNCESHDITGVNLASDLLDARELIKEMREELREVLVSREHGEAKEMVFITNFAEIEAILERTKEYQ